MKTSATFRCIKNILPVLAALLAVACSKQPSEPEAAYGRVALKIGQAPQIEVVAKAAAEIADDYNIIIRQGTDVVRNDTYGNLKHFFALRAGGYDITAQNCTEAVAVTGRGAQRFAGTAAFTITGGETETVSFECSMTNARVSLRYTEDFKTVFSDYTVTVYESSLPDRKVSFDMNATTDDPAYWSYFNITAAPEITVSVTATRNDNTVKTYTKKFPIAKKTWYKLTVSSLSVNGQAGLDITVDDTMLEQSIDMDVDPYL